MRKVATCAKIKGEGLLSENLDWAWYKFDKNGHNSTFLGFLFVIQFEHYNLKLILEKYVDIKIKIFCFGSFH